MEQEKKGNVAALLPIGVFLLLYLGLGIVFEYVMGVSMGFYNIPIVVVFLIALLVACLQNRALPFDDKLAVMGRGIGDKTIVTMILIFRRRAFSSASSGVTASRAWRIFCYR